MKSTARARGPPHSVGTDAFSSASQTSGLPSEGARQSPRGDREPPDEIFGPLGNADRLNWLSSKKRYRKTRSHCLISERLYTRFAASGILGGQRPRSRSPHAFHDR